MYLNLCSKVPFFKTLYSPKILIVMKLTVLIITVACLQVSAAAFSQKVTISEKNAAMSQVLSSLQKQTNYTIFYNNNLLKKATSVSLELHNVNLTDALDALFKDQPLTYTIVDQTIVIKEKEKGFFDKLKDKINELLPPGSNLNGLVTNANNEPLTGATVIIKRTKTGTNSDIHGFFMLRSVEPSDSLIISYIGYKTITLPVGKTGLLLVKMDETTNGLDEVVVQGYGRTTQRTTTGNIGSVSAKEIEVQPVSNPLLALEGKIPGVVVTPQSGYEDGPVKIEIRGRNSINSAFTTDPLYIIDGVPLTVLDVAGTIRTSNSNTNISRGLDQTGMSYSGGESPLYNINPLDIQSIEVLKDADATAIYGSRGANGVILITTKRGVAGTNKFDINVNDGTNFATRFLPLLNTQEYLAMRREQFKNDGITPTIANAADLTLWSPSSYTDWEKYAYGGIGNRVNLQATLSGGTEQTTFRVSGGYARSTDITAVSGANQRGTVAFNVTNKSTNKRLAVSITGNYSYSDVNQINLNGLSNLPPNAPPVYTADGGLNFLQYSQANVTYPFSSLLKPYNNTGNSLTANINVNYNILKGLNAGISVGYTNNQNYQTSFNPIASQNPYATTPPTGSASFGNTHASNWIAEPQLTYNRLVGKGTLDVLAGATMQANTTEGLLVNGTGYTSDAFIRTISLAPVTTSTDNYGEYRYAGVFARLGYNWQGKYIVNFNGRRDGSSRFGPGNQFGNFGSAGIAWIASDEKWLKKILPKAIDFIKLRSSYGITGSDNVNDYQYLAQWGSVVSSGNTAKLTTYNGVTPLVPQLMANSNFHWQVNKKLDAELSIELLEGALNFDVDYYQNRCDNQLVSLVTPEFTGFTGVTANNPADVQNSGWEFTIGANLVKGSTFAWRNTFNIAFNHNVLLAYPGLATSPYRNTYQVGKSLNLQYLLNFTGIDPQTGQYTYTDYNGDGKLNSVITVPHGTQYDDAYVTVDQEPAFTGGMSSVLTYKKFTLSMNFAFAKQMGINLINGGASSAGIGPTNIARFVYDNRWYYPGQTDALYGRLSTGALVAANVNSSNAGWSNSSYFRFKTVTLSYTLPSAWLRRAGIRNLSANVSTNNLFVITAYKGYDPEVNTFGGQPPFRTVVSGLTISF